MGETIVVTSGKGGVGKTTVTANLGTGLALLGHRTALVDADLGLRNLDVVLGLENRIVYDLVDVVDGLCRLKQALVKDKRFDGLYLLPAAQTKDKTAVSPAQMRDVCAELEAEFEFVLVDCPAGIEQGFRNAIAGADWAIVVTTPEVAAVRDADRVIGLLEAAGLPPARLIVNRIRPDMVRRGDLMGLEDVVDILALELLGAIPEDEGILVATNRGDPAILRHGSASAQAFRNIARRVAGEHVPLLELSPSAGLFGRLRRLLGMRAG